MGKFSEILKRDRIYAILFFILVAVNVLVFSELLGERSVRFFGGHYQYSEIGLEEGSATGIGGKKMFDPEDVKARQKRIEEMATDSPMLYFFLGMVNLSIMFTIFVGIVIDIALFARRKKGEKLDITLAQVEKPAWNVSDVLRVVILFLSAGYLFAFLQAFFSEKLPIMQNVNFRMILDTAFMNVVAMGVILHFVFRKYHQGRSALGLADTSVWKVIYTATAGYVAVIPILVGIMVLTYFFIQRIGYEPPVQPIVEVFIEEKEVSVLWVSVLFAAIFGPLAEELFFRGFVYPAVKKKWGILTGIIGTSVIFSLLHTHIVGFLPIMVLGVVLAYLYEKTGSLLVPMAVHMIHNMGMVCMVFLMRAME